MELILDRISEHLKRTGQSESAWRREVHDGTTTPPVKVGLRAAAIPRHEADAIIAARMNGATPAQLRKVVADLMKQRKALLPASLRTDAAP